VSAWQAFAAPAGTPGRPAWQRAVQRARRAAYGAAIAAAAWVNDRAYNTAVRANRVQGWLVRRRDAR
jgi:hypothetical protein